MSKHELINICRREIPGEVLYQANLSFLDWLGCVFAARDMPVATALSRGILENEADLLDAALCSSTTDAQTAALLTGALGNALEMDDLHRASLLHAGDTVCASAVSVAIRQGAGGRALLEAIVRGYEASIRISTAAASGGYTPFYNSGTCGIFGSAMAASDLKGLSADQMADALAQAGMQASGIWQCRLEPGFSKQLACAHAARAGVLCAQLAQAGFPGPRQILTGPLGFFASYYPNADLEALVAQGTSDWAISDVSFKPFPACRHTHPAISAALALRCDMALEQIDQIEIATYSAAIEFCDNPEPETGHEARFSLQHATAIALVRGTARIEDFAAEARQDREIARIRAKIGLSVDPESEAGFPEKFGTRLKIRLHNGTTLEQLCPVALGDPEDPMSADALREKFLANLAHGRVAAAHARQIWDIGLNSRHLPDLTSLLDALHLSPTPSPKSFPCR